MHWAQALAFCGCLMGASIYDVRHRLVDDRVCVALLAALPFYLCAGFGLMGGGDVRLAAAVGFVLDFDRVITGFSIMAIALLLASFAMRVIPALRKGASAKQPLVPYFAVAFIPAYFI